MTKPPETATAPSVARGPRLDPIGEAAKTSVVATLNRAPAPAPQSRPLFNVEDLAAHVRRITTTDEGKLQIVLEGEGIDDPTIAKVRDLLQLQQDLVLVTIRPAQGDLFT
jgi:hypothetical protein